MADVSYYRDILKDETDLLDSNIEKYNKILDEDFEMLPESVVGQIHLVIGQSKLFINERFKQFSGLIDDCECKRGEKEIKVEDLAGFWDMISFQINDLKAKYDELKQLESNNWKPIEKPRTVTSTISFKKSFQNINGTKKTTNGNINDTIDGNHKLTKMKPVKSNFREFLKNKAKEQKKCIDETSILSNSHKHIETTSNNNNDDDIQIMIMVNNNHYETSSKLKNGHDETNINNNNVDNVKQEIEEQRKDESTKKNQQLVSVN